MIITGRTGRTSRMLAYAIGAARQGREIAIIVNTEEDRRRMHAQLSKAAEEAGCKWVVGDGINGGNGGNIEIYHVAHVSVTEQAPGDYQIRGSSRDRSREVLVDHFVYEDRYGAVIENYIRWL